MVKLPLLFVHFTNHVSEGEGMSISEFISMHYLANPVIDDDYLQDRFLLSLLILVKCRFYHSRFSCF